MSKYSMVMSWSEEDQAYIVSVPELPGCMAFRAMLIKILFFQNLYSIIKRSYLKGFS